MGRTATPDQITISLNIPQNENSLISKNPKGLLVKRLLITSAAGKLGSERRSRLAHMADILRLLDVVDIGLRAPNKEVLTYDLGDKAYVEELVKSCDGIGHLGGRSNEDTWEVIHNANIDGMFNLYEAARKHGNPRILFASSNHAIGFY